MNPNDLSVVKNHGIDTQVIKAVAATFQEEYDANTELYDTFRAQRSQADVTGTNVRRVALWVVGSIKTDTRLVDSGADSILSGDFKKDKDFLEGTTDGDIKWEKYGDWFASDLPDQVAELLRNDEIDDAHALLAGRDPDTGKNIDDYYLRANKASLVLYLLGFDRICFDTRNYRAFQPVIRETLKWARPVSHPETELANPYRHATPNANAKTVPVMSHSGDPDWDRESSYWEDKLKWNIPQYDCLTRFLRDKVAEHCDIPAELIPQVAFNTEGDTTVHSGLMDRL